MIFNILLACSNQAPTTAPKGLPHWVAPWVIFKSCGYDLCQGEKINKSTDKTAPVSQGKHRF
jgi:hypothetical protein